ncbi:hypothetical protein Bca4012_027268 [Brassica carinata]
MEGPSKWLRKGAWAAEEDTLLRQCIDKYGEGKWHQIPLRAGLNRCRKSCRLRWLNYLKPNIKKGKFSTDEVDLLLRLHKLLGNRWSLIAGRLPGRTANDVKNYWNTNLGKKQEPCYKSKTRKTEITWSNTTPAQKLDVIKPRPRFFTVNASNQLYGPPEIVHGEVSNKKEEQYKFVNNLMDGKGMWWENLVEESQETYVLGSEATTTENGEYSSFFNSVSPTFDVEDLWSILDADTGEPD